jgi:hypothetical protein
VDATSPASSEGLLEVRRVNEADSFEALTQLLHRAYVQWEHTNYRSVILSKSHHG